MDTCDEFLRRPTPSALLTADGTIQSLNAPMAATLGRPTEECLGYGFLRLLPESQRPSAESGAGRCCPTHDAAPAGFLAQLAVKAG